ncbi:MAG: IclR family transcriptional regulator [Tissierellia bacterium]|nr:IclR family transcriptional regulator [Tissierellia bacterium]
MEQELRDDYIVPMVDRATRIIQYIYEQSRPCGIGELSKELGIPKATAFKILYTLKIHGFISQNKDDNYKLGISFLTYGQKVKSNLDIASMSHPILEKYALKTGESFNLGLHYKEYAVNVDTVIGEKFYLINNLVPLSPLHCSSMGKIFLTYMEEKERQDFFSKELEIRTVNTKTTYEDFQKMMKVILETGLSQDNEEYEYGLTCFGTGIFQKNSTKPIAAISLSGPTTRLKVKGYDTLKKSLLEAKKELEDTLESLEFFP